MQNSTESKRKKIIYRARYRGTKEMDIIIGNFINAHINNADENTLDEMAELLKVSDRELQAIILRQEKSPHSEKIKNIMPKLIEFAQKYHDR